MEKKSLIRVRKDIKKRFIQYLLFGAEIALLVAVVASIVFATKVDMTRHANVSVEFTYEGISQGLTPNRNQFTVDDVLNEAVLSSAIEKSGLNDKMTVEELSKNIMLTGVYPQNIVDSFQKYNSLLDYSISRTDYGMEYYPTEFTIRIYDGFSTSVTSAELKKLAKNVSESYREYFLKNYSYSNVDAAMDTIYDLNSMDYLENLDFLQMRLDFIMKYANSLYEIDSAYNYKGNSFDTLAQRADYIQRTSLANLRSYVTSTGLTKDRSRAIITYNYRIKRLENELTLLPPTKERLNALMAAYVTDGTMYFGVGDSMITIEGNSAHTYESLVGIQTKLDELTAEDNRNISVYSAYLADIRNASSNTTVKNRAQEELNLLTESIQNLSADFSTMLEAYNKVILPENAVVVSKKVSVTNDGFFSKAMIMNLLKFEIPAAFVWMIYICLREFIIHSKKFSASLVRSK